MTTEGQDYNITAIRELLTAAFMDSRYLRRFCQSHSDLRPVLQLVNEGAGFQDHVDVLIGYCETRLLFDELLAGVGQDNPRQYERHKDRLYEMSQPQPASLRTLIPNQIYRIISKNSGKCLDVKMQSTADGANVQQYSCHHLDNQLWKLVPTGDGCWHIIAKHSGKYLEVENQGTGDNVNVRQHQYHGRDNQKWELIDLGDGDYRIRAKHSGKCMDVQRQSTADGANVQQYRCHDLDNQKWQLELVERTDNTQVC